MCTGFVLFSGPGFVAYRIRHRQSGRHIARVLWLVRNVESTLLILGLLCTQDRLSNSNYHYTRLRIDPPLGRFPRKSVGIEGLRGVSCSNRCSEFQASKPSERASGASSLLPVSRSNCQHQETQRAANTLIYTLARHLLRLPIKRED